MRAIEFDPVSCTASSSTSTTCTRRRCASLRCSRSATACNLRSRRDCSRHPRCPITGRSPL